MMSRILFLVAVMAVVGCGSCQNLEEPPAECIITGSSLISTCAKEVAVSTQYFNITPGDSEGISKLKIVPNQLDGLLEEIGEPTKSCCKGTCEFTASYCGCNDQMVEVINGFIGNNFSFFRSVSEAIANRCGIRIYYEENCPRNKWQKKWKKFATSSCKPFE